MPATFEEYDLRHAELFVPDAPKLLTPDELSVNVTRMPIRVGIQMGHCRQMAADPEVYEECIFVNEVANGLCEELTERGHDPLLLWADEGVPFQGDAFVSLHLDKAKVSTPPELESDQDQVWNDIHGASVGYPVEEGQLDGENQLAASWKRHYQTLGYPWGFHLDNYDPAIKSYYAFEWAKGYRQRVVIMFGMVSNEEEFVWLSENKSVCIQSVVNAIEEVFGVTTKEQA